jgi:hypothetical protein
MKEDHSLLMRKENIFAKSLLLWVYLKPDIRFASQRDLLFMQRIKQSSFVTKHQHMSIFFQHKTLSHLTFMTFKYSSNFLFLLY